FENYGISDSDYFEKDVKNFDPKMPDSSVVEICKILDLKLGSKDNMISEIIKFLLKPVKIVLSPVNPFDPSMQPVVKLKKISLDNKYLKKSLKMESNKKPVTSVKSSKRKRIPSTKLEIYVSAMDSKKKISLPENKSDSPFKTEKKKSLSGKQSAVKVQKDVKSKTSNIKAVSPKKVITTITKSSQSVNMSPAARYMKKKRKMRFKSRKTSRTLNSRQKLVKKAITGQKIKSPIKAKSPIKTDIKEETAPENLLHESEVKQEAVVAEVHEMIDATIKNETDESIIFESCISFKQDDSEANNLSAELEKMDNSSDATLSSDEAKQLVKADSPKKRVTHKRVGKPLRHFTKIKENILNANFSALQRLHILLFGASDKADNLKGNILAFGGFPFLEGSEEWKQKEFLLSLLAQSTLREYLNILCIAHGDDDQRVLISKLMRFLAAPSDKPPGKTYCQYVVD
ncbi:DEK_C domain-containing protein, partial [Trichonephila clavata]